MPFNDLPVLEKTLKTRKDEVAAVILEPVCYNTGCLKPRPGYLEADNVARCGASLAGDFLWSRPRHAVDRRPGPVEQGRGRSGSSANWALSSLTVRVGLLRVMDLMGFGVLCSLPFLP